VCTCWGDWHLDSSSSDNISEVEDSKPSAVEHLDDNNNSNNDNGIDGGINLEDFEETEDYEPTDGFHQNIIDIMAWTHEDLADIPAHAVHSIMQHWDKHTYCWYCYNCNQLMMSTRSDSALHAPTSTPLKVTMGLTGTLECVSVVKTLVQLKCALSLA
jgi:hypothetical protein